MNGIGTSNAGLRAKEAPTCVADALDHNSAFLHAAHNCTVGDPGPAGATPAVDASFAIAPAPLEATPAPAPACNTTLAIATGAHGVDDADYAPEGALARATRACDHSGAPLYALPARAASGVGFTVAAGTTARGSAPAPAPSVPPSPVCIAPRGVLDGENRGIAQYTEDRCRTAPQTITRVFFCGTC